MHTAHFHVAAWAIAAAAAPCHAQITLFDQEDFRGRSLTVEVQSGHLGALSFNDRASSAVVNGGAWELCTNANYAGRCTVLRPGQYASFQALGLDDRVTSLRPHGDDPRDGGYKTERERQAGQAQARSTALSAAERGENGRSSAGAYDARRRGKERLFVVTLDAVREVRGSGAQRCWVELPLRGVGDAGSLAAPAPVAAPTSAAASTPVARTAFPPATVGASTAAGFLGHDAGGRPSDQATEGLSSLGMPACAVGGNRSGQAGPTPQRVSYWDAAYTFRGVSHRVQTNTLPPPTLSVNERGEPRQ